MTAAPGRSLLAEHALAIWRAGVDAVRAERLVANAVQRERDELVVCGERFSLPAISRVVIVGAGKAGAGMAAPLEQLLDPDGELQAGRVCGWVNVPADCVRPLRHIVLHPARPAGVNEPTEAGVEGTARILKLVESLTPADLCLVLISGGGSALLPAPIDGITLADKQAVTRFLMHAGASIQELNTVRKRLSAVKGGNLARRMPAGGSMRVLIISDVVGDPLDIIASGPTVEDSGTATDALAVLNRFGAAPPEVPESVFSVLRAHAARGTPAAPFSEGVVNHVIGNNETALAAAAIMARQLGYNTISLGSGLTGEASAWGAEFAARCQSLRAERTATGQPVCLLSGGEPVVQLPPAPHRGRGGRNQQVVLSALDTLWEQGLDGIALLSGGTDGEDGPTDAAGAIIDQPLWEHARAAGDHPAADRAACNAYPYFARHGGLLMTGPTHTNVMDLRVAIVG